MDQPYRMGGIEVRPVERELRVDGMAVPVGARAFDVLLALIERRERVVTKNELLDLVWPDTVVEENNLQSQVSQLRKILGPKAIATIPGRGYRFAMAVDSSNPGSATAPDAPVASLLPGVDARLVGRDPDLAAVIALLASHRMVTVAGAGGIGKTRLAQEVASQQAGRYAHGVGWVDLAAIASAENIAPGIANAADLQLGDGQPETLLARAIGARELLLVLDNCEHLAADVALLAQALLGKAPGLRILATSQEVLHVAGEHVYRLGALAVPVPGTPLETARRFGAIALLEQRATAADGRFALGEESLPGAIELCRRLDGIALAIEMAAAWLPVLGAEALLARLDERMKLLRSAARGVPPRHQTLQALLDWSHSLLSEEERAVFRRLAVFRGSFRLEAAQHVAGWGALDEWSALDALIALADKSLVQVEGGEAPRYRLLESARIYAFDQLARHGETEEVLDRRDEAMARLAQAAYATYWGMPESPTCAQWYPDYDDVHAAFDRAAARGDPEVMARTNPLLTTFDFERNVYSTVRRRKEAALAALPRASPFARAWLLNAVSLFRLILIPSAPRVRIAEERVAAWRAVANRRHVCFALGRLAADYAVDGRMEESAATLAEAEALEDPAWTPHIRWFHAFAGRNACAYREDPVELRRWSRAMLALAQQAKWPPRIAESRIACAEAALLAGDVEEAIHVARQAAEELRALNQPINLLDALTALSASHVAAGDLDAARDAAREVLQLPWQLESAIMFFDQVARLAALDGRCEQAARLFGFADRGYEATQDRRHGIGALALGHAAAAIDATLGSDEHARLRKAGAALAEDQAHAIAREVLGDGKTKGGA